MKKRKIKKQYSRFLALIILSTFVFFACRKEIEKVSWDTKLFTPIGELNLFSKDLLNTESLQSDGNNFLSFIHSEEIFSFLPLDNLIELNVESFTRTITLSTLELENFQHTERITIADIDETNSIPETGTTLPAFLLPSLVLPPPPPFQIDISDVLVSATLTRGYADMIINNQLDVDIRDLEIEVRNASNGVVVFTTTIPNIPRKQTHTISAYDIAAQLNGEPIEGQLEAEIKSFSFGASPGQVVFSVYPTDYIEFSFSVYDLNVSSAFARFPEQNVIENSDNVPLQDIGDAELTKAIILSGNVVVRVRHTLPTPLFIDYRIPKATKNGQSFRFQTEVPQAPEGTTVVIEESFPFDGYEFDMRGENGDLTNVFFNEIFGRIQATPSPVALSLSDTLYVELSIENMTASYVEGYLGQSTFSEGPESITIDNQALEIGLLDNLDIEKVELSIRFENEVGIPATIVLNDLGFFNASGQSYSPTALPTNVPITSARKNPQTNGTGIYTMENAKPLLDIKPNRVNYAFDLQTNPAGNTPPLSNFAGNTQAIKAFLDVNVPLSIRSDGYVLYDTLEVDFENNENFQNVKDGLLSVTASNSFPLNAKMGLIFLDKNRSVIDSVATKDLIEASPINKQNALGRTIGLHTSTLSYSIKDQQVAKVISPATKYIVSKVVLLTSPQDGYVKIYDDYEIGLKLSARFNYHLRSKL